MPKRIEISKEFLEEEYLVKKKSVRQIGREVGLKSSKAILRGLKEYGIATRPKRTDLADRTYGKLYVEEFVGHTGDKHGCLWRCKCECGNSTTVLSTNLLNGTTISCGCWVRLYSGKPVIKWKGFGEIPGTMWCQISKSAELRNIEIKITPEFLHNLYLKQNRKCALSGIEIVFNKSYKKTTTASLDRIDSEGIYEEGNVQWVHKDINWMKQHFDEEYLLLMCRLMVNHADKTNEKPTTSLEPFTFIG